VSRCAPGDNLAGMDSWPAPPVPSLPGRAPEPWVRDTASGRELPAAQGHVATMYACGITPYDATHMGHAATYIASDLLVRALRDAGHDVRYVQNVTDVDDPLLERAERDGLDWRQLADREIGRFRSDMTALRVLPPDSLVGAVEAIGLIEEFSTVLAGRDALYELEGDTYFCRSADPAFGAVSGLDNETMIELSAERGGDPGRPGKKDPLDPLVWLATRPGEPAWDSKFGLGRPGWHVECAAIATTYLGPTFDVQAGGSDLIFPHHEMSASHARVAFGAAGAPGVAGAGGEAFARRYVHAGMVRLDGEKMSKSLGNLVLVSELRKSGTDPMAIRLAVLAHRYRDDWDWTDEGLAAATARLDRWREAARTPKASAGDRANAAGAEVLRAMRERLADDLDAPGALDVVDKWADEVLAARGSAGDAGARHAAAAPTAESDSGLSAANLVPEAVDALLGVAL
jgi:L-cysteine:1D-myo-inositol 2-amino-2-deoxy-alpha-D-glucopyranoside ligase